MLEDLDDDAQDEQKVVSNKWTQPRINLYYLSSVGQQPSNQIIYDSNSVIGLFENDFIFIYFIWYAIYFIRLRIKQVQYFPSWQDHNDQCFVSDAMDLKIFWSNSSTLL